MSKFDKALVEAIEKELPNLLPNFRWFGAKSQRTQSVRIARLWPAFPMESAALAVVEARFDEGRPVRYLLPLVILHPEELDAAKRKAQRLGIPHAIISEAAGVTEGTLSEEYCAALLRFILERKCCSFGVKSSITGLTTRSFEMSSEHLLRKLDAGDLPPKLLGVEQSNTSVRYGDSLVLKLIRKFESGTNLDVEVTRFLTDTAHFKHSAQLVGTLELQSNSAPVALASVASFVPNAGDAWNAICQKSNEGDYRQDIEMAALLGRRTFEMHHALASGRGAYAPEKLSFAGQRTLSARLRRHAVRVLNEAEALKETYPAHIKEGLEELLGKKREIVARFDILATTPLRIPITRTHGDYHMGQVLTTGRDFVILDFEGEPMRPLKERGRKQSPLRDVAGLLRSIHYAVTCTIFSTDKELERSLRQSWIETVSRAFLEGYCKASQHNKTGKSLVPKDRKRVHLLLDIFVLEKALYELQYEMRHRPDWIYIPLSGLLELSKEISG